MSTQILKPLPGKHDKGVEWPDDEVQSEDWEDDIDENGTDYKGGKVKKSFRMYSQLIHDEDLLKAIVEDDEDDNDVHEDDNDVHEDDDAKRFREMMASKENKKSLGKSFFDYIASNEIISEGIDSSPFLYEMTKSIGLSLMNLENRIGTVIHTVDSDADSFAKSLDGVFNNFSDQLAAINGTAEDIDIAKATDEAGGDVEYLEKGDFGTQDQVTRTDVLNALVKGVEAGQVSPLEVIKFEHTGAISPELQKSLGLQGG